ncbi:TetR family transcriptional regulator [Brachybacterium sp. Marseille-Q2903]|uniref:TetR family transcriptional regulator n=1 Tax=Brachybacterium epidermidis TaxID=2781983 RepID=A0ABR9W4W0_9MICO|nr:MULTISPECIES: TetR family transcriptional regulator [Brachybacterium]MBE9404995.1 TetR family transcriptional regulator [Brachybacterium epidermidis]MCT1776830.1 TetR family transcriptional regulator [Brachybacterium sp. p3-SID957]
MTSTPLGTSRRRPTGRRAGDSGTRDAILDAARDLFAEHALEGTSMRAIAKQAGVDPALIRHFFTDKETLFATTMTDRTVIIERMRAALPGDPDSLGERMTNEYLLLWEDDELRPVLMALVRSATTSQNAADLLIELFTARMHGDSLEPGVPITQLRGAALAASHLFGVAVARHILHVPAVVDIPHDELVQSIAPAIQNYLNPTARPQ